MEREGNTTDPHVADSSDRQQGSPKHLPATPGELNLGKKVLLVSQFFPNANFFYKGKGTVNVIKGNPPCKDGNTRFTQVPIKALSDQVGMRYQSFCFLELF